MVFGLCSSGPWNSSLVIFVIFEKLKKTKTELHPISRNVKSHVNPFEVVREYQRALNATKLERVFAKPFVGSLEGHTDGVSIITKNPLKLSRPGIFGRLCPSLNPV